MKLFIDKLQQIDQFLIEFLTEFFKLILNKLQPSIAHCATKDSEQKLKKQSWVGWWYKLPTQKQMATVKPQTTAGLVHNETKINVDKSTILLANAEKQFSNETSLNKTQWTLEGRIEALKQMKAIAENGLQNQGMHYANSVMTNQEFVLEQQKNQTPTQILSTQVGQFVGQAAAAVGTPFMQLGAEAAAKGLGMHSRKKSWSPQINWA